MDSNGNALVVGQRYTLSTGQNVRYDGINGLNMHSFQWVHPYNHNIIVILRNGEYFNTHINRPVHIPIAYHDDAPPRQRGRGGRAISKKRNKNKQKTKNKRRHSFRRRRNKSFVRK